MRTKSIILDFQICVVIPRKYIHSNVFYELALLLKCSLNDLGYPCVVKVNDLNPDKTNIILGYHLLYVNAVSGDIIYIPWQLEQLKTLWSENSYNILKNATRVWDYSTDNIAFLQQFGIQADCITIGYHPALKTINKVPNPDIDVLFYGSLTRRRKLVLDELTDRGVNVTRLFGVYGAERDKIISRSKIILNVHFSDVKDFEAVRVSYCLNNACFVLSENSSAYPWPNVDLPFVPYERIVQTCLEYLADFSSIRRQSIKTYNSFKSNYSMADILRDALVPVPLAK